VSIEQDSKRRELERLWRKSYWLSGSVFLVAPLIFLNDGDRMFALSLMLTRKFHLPLEAAELLVTPLLLIPVIAIVVLGVLILQNQLKINRLGCINCGASRPRWTGRMHPYCVACELQQHESQ
jgi:hypothetical protein